VGPHSTFLYAVVDIESENGKWVYEGPEKQQVQFTRMYKQLEIYKGPYY